MCFPSRPRTSAVRGDAPATRWYRDPPQRLPVHYPKTIDVCRLVPKKVAYTVTRCVPKVVWREVACEPDCGAEPGCAKP